MLTVSMLANPGHGDVLMAAPAIRAMRTFNAIDPDQLLAWALPPALQALGRWLDVAQVVGKVPDGLCYQLDSLWSPTHHPDICNPAVNRTDLFARFLGVEGFPLDASWPAPGPHGPTIVLAWRSAQANRTLPPGLVKALAAGIEAAGAKVTVMGHPGSFEKLLDLVGRARAVIAVDSFPMHLAAAMGRPLVAIMPTYPAHARLKHYAGPLVPLAGHGPGWPPGENADTSWVESFRPDQILGALWGLLRSVGG